MIEILFIPFFVIIYYVALFSNFMKLFIKKKVIYKNKEYNNIIYWNN